MPNRLALVLRLRVRHVRDQTAFPLARGLPSTTSAAVGVSPAALFGSFTGTTPRSDFPRRWLVVVRLLASPRALHLHPSWFGAATVGIRDLPVPDKLFPSMMRSQTAQGPGTPRQNGAPGVAFGMTPLPRHPRLRLFRGSILSLPVPLSTLRLRRYRRLRMTRGRCGWLLLQRMSPSDTTTRQSPGARRLTIRSTGHFAAVPVWATFHSRPNPDCRKMPVSSNYKGFPACQAERVLNESRKRFKLLAVGRTKAHRVVLDAH